MAALLAMSLLLACGAEGMGGGEGAWMRRGERLLDCKAGSVLHRACSSSLFVSAPILPMSQARHANFRSFAASSRRISSRQTLMPSLLSRVIRPQRAGLRGLRATAGDGVVVGVNKYSHDTSVCISCCKTGEPLLIWSKERQSRRKHDGGDIAELMQAALQHLNLSQDDVALVVSNNHHFRVLPYEEQHTQLAWSAALGHIPASYSSDFNLLPAARHLEVSHHLAHAWSAAAQAPFDKGLVVVMDGMGESFSAMRSAKEKEEQDYFHDLLLAEDEKFLQTHDVEQQEKGARHGFREAESAYMFQKDRATNTISLNKVMKRWTEEVSPPELYNHGFENMQSVGAVYSRVSSNIFGDWNACGKVMGLAPWHSLWSKDSSKPPLIMRGNVLKNELEINHDELRKQPLAGQKFGLDAGDWSESTKYSSIAEYTSKLAFAVQKDLESVALQMIEELKIHTGARNLCFVGGVGLNSVLNGRISRELGFEKVFIPPYPGDDGIAVGCCAFGLFSGNGRRALAAKAKLAPKLWAGPLSPYQGPQYSLTDIEEAVEASLPWLEVKEAKSVDDFLDRMVSDMADGHVIAWWQGRSEAGPRALGHRSILADPRRANMVSHINSKVKGREAFRPFAPSVLAAGESASDA
eukprot:337499-Hanusia_phi.AAC.1